MRSALLLLVFALVAFVCHQPPARELRVEQPAISNTNDRAVRDEQPADENIGLAELPRERTFREIVSLTHLQRRCAFDRPCVFTAAEEEMLRTAEMSDLLSAFAALISERSYLPGNVATAIQFGTAEPLHLQLRTALRELRDAPNPYHRPWELRGLFDYFARHGDASDLPWMEREFARMQGPQRVRAEEQLRAFRARTELN